MCRWFAYISETEECLLEDVLITPKHSMQVHDHYLPKLLSHDPNQNTTAQEIKVRNRLFNVDGTGVAWYTSSKADFGECHDQRPALYKTTQPPLNDLNFRSICANTSTRVAFAHIRMATATPVVMVNNHPFVFGCHTFMHNGEVSNFVDVRRELCDLLDKDAFENIHGGTDSEHLAALYISILTDGKGKATWEKQTTPAAMRDALRKTVDTVIALQKKKLGAKAIPNDLNMASTDGRHLIAFRIRNHPTEQPPSLYYSTTAGQTLNRKYPDLADGGVNHNAHKAQEDHPKHVVVASEPTTYKDSEWTLVEKNHCLLVDGQGNVSLENVQPTA